MFASIQGSFAGDTYVNGYTRSNGTYVQGHYRSAPDNTRDNNYGTYGNSNPYTGTAGAQPRDNGDSESTERSRETLRRLGGSTDNDE